MTAPVPAAQRTARPFCIGCGYHYATHGTHHPNCTALTRERNRS